MPAAPDARAPETPAPPRMRFVRALGEGGMGVVFLADRELGGGLTQRVVVKRPRADAGEPSARALERFADEARALARVGHANVIRLLDAGADAHGPWLALEHVDGVDAHVLLESLRAGPERLTADELAWVAHEAARGMAAAHGLRDALGEPAPVLHRDLSPQNLLLSRHGEVKVADFGIAWAVDRSTRTTTGVVVGNLRYIAPEQLEGRAVGPATDVYGLGRVLEELLEVTDPAADGLRAVAARATRRDPDERHPTMDALAEALREAVPTLARGGASLGRRVETIAHGRAQVTSALAGLLAAERADNDRVSLPAAPPAAAKETTRAPAQEVPRAVPAPTTEAPRPAPPRASRKPALAAAAALVVAGVMAGAQRTRAPVTAAGVTEAGARPVTTVATPTPERAPEVTPEAPPEAPEVHAPPETPAQPEAPVATPTRIPGRRGPRDAIRAGAAVTADASVAAPTAACTAPAPARLIVNAIPWAMLSVDDGPAVPSPHTFEVSPGQHRVRARRSEGNGEATQTVTVSAGEDRRIGLTP